VNRTCELITVLSQNSPGVTEEGQFVVTHICGSAGFWFNCSVVVRDCEAGATQSVYLLTTDWNTGVRSPAEAKNFPVASVSRPALGPTQPPVQWVPCFSPGVNRGQAWLWPLSTSSAEIKMSRSYIINFIYIIIIGTVQSNIGRQIRTFVNELADKHFEVSHSGAVCLPNQHFILGNVTILVCIYSSLLILFWLFKTYFVTRSTILTLVGTGEFLCWQSWLPNLVTQSGGWKLN
jgi:hypothetical protein